MLLRLYGGGRGAPFLLLLLRSGRRLGGRLVVRGVVVPHHVAGGDAPRPNDRDQQVGEILADARAAFESGSVDAWGIWDPFYSAVDLEGRARLLANGEGLGLSGPFYLAARPYAEANPGFIQPLLDELTRAEALTRSDEAGSVRLLAQFMGLPEAVIVRAFSHRPASPILPVSAEIVAAQQRTADLFLENHLLPKRVDVASAVWQPAP